jgi:hypothetical protein
MLYSLPFSKIWQIWRANLNILKSRKSTVESLNLYILLVSKDPAGGLIFEWFWLRTEVLITSKISLHFHTGRASIRLEKKIDVWWWLLKVFNFLFFEWCMQIIFLMQKLQKLKINRKFRVITEIGSTFFGYSPVTEQVKSAKWFWLFIISMEFSIDIGISGLWPSFGRKPKKHKVSKSRFLGFFIITMKFPINRV